MFEILPLVIESLESYTEKYKKSFIWLFTAFCCHNGVMGDIAFAVNIAKSITQYFFMQSYEISEIAHVRFTSESRKKAKYYEHRFLQNSLHLILKSSFLGPLIPHLLTNWFGTFTATASEMNELKCC